MRTISTPGVSACTSSSDTTRKSAIWLAVTAFTVAECPHVLLALLRGDDDFLESCPARAGARTMAA
ncbi:MAG: hypothetical protein IPF57_24660 [Gammaproteobacteria bacterium]|nr:hypothetical protein [Gammaproteobacteria bacterium]